MRGFSDSTRIAGISDVRRLPRVGKIRLGVKLKSAKGNDYPSEVSYFVLKPEDCASRAIFDRWTKAYGEKPTEIEVMFPVEDERVFFPQAFKKYGAAGLVCKGDGQTYSRIDQQTGEILEGDCPTPEDCPFAQDDKGRTVCKRIGNLIVLLPRVTWSGTFQIDTSSFNSIVDINSAIDFYRQLAGRIVMVPLKLRRVAKETMYGGKKATHYPMTLGFPDSVGEIKGLLGEAQKVRSVFELFQPAGRLQIEGPQANEVESDLYPKGTAPGALRGLPAPQEPGNGGHVLTDAEKEAAVRRAMAEREAEKAAETLPPAEPESEPPQACADCQCAITGRMVPHDVGDGEVVCSKCRAKRDRSGPPVEPDPPPSIRESQAEAAAAKDAFENLF